MISFGQKGLGGGVPSMCNDVMRVMRGGINGATGECSWDEFCAFVSRDVCKHFLRASFKGGMRGLWRRPTFERCRAGNTPSRTQLWHLRISIYTLVAAGGLLTVQV